MRHVPGLEPFVLCASSEREDVPPAVFTGTDPLGRQAKWRSDFHVLRIIEEVGLAHAEYHADRRHRRLHLLHGGEYRDVVRVAPRVHGISSACSVEWREKGALCLIEQRSGTAPSVFVRPSTPCRQGALTSETEAIDAVNAAKAVVSNVIRIDELGS